MRAILTAPLTLIQNIMESIKKRHQQKYGYSPTDNEVLSLYLNGELTLSDKEENKLIKHFNL
jgi:hypothetical protein